ncbi:hydrolase [Metarhizium album ARSEF 1941]|uniref:Hydrolase n=1 Tax=Metarhizium album (strain ARSEF 1941) TaxID=1081103 RepID=A0A0B2WSI8_METAS|nr:hydrolase [Metarhizium album ARSEF 1941]KHN96998.1 hydrolase [Metarhizium album ARSEF 1941]
MSSGLTIDDALVAKVTHYVEAYMANYDPSHDFNHVQRVLRLAKHIQATLPSTSLDAVTLSALLHDVGDKKYLKPGEDSSRLVFDALRSFGASEALAEKVQAICLGVSYSSEVKDPGRVMQLIEAHPELAVVQDADRLDAIGAVGIGRAFAFGGARNRDMGNTMEHFAEKLVRLEGMMKTDEGRRLAKERTERIVLMQQWWRDETAS